MQSLDQGPLVRSYVFCLIYPLFGRRYDRAVVGWAMGVPMKRFIGVAAEGGQPAAVELSKLSAGNGATGVGGATGITAASLNGRSDTTRDWVIL